LSLCAVDFAINAGTYNNPIYPAICKWNRHF
jgi:hypothetical protein